MNAQQTAAVARLFLKKPHNMINRCKCFPSSFQMVCEKLQNNRNGNELPIDEPNMKLLIDKICHRANDLKVDTKNAFDILQTINLSYHQ